jgi:hypothetical protein
MSLDERFSDDPVLRRVAAARPAMREEDLSPTSEVATAMAERVLSTPRPTPSPSRRLRARWSRRTRRTRRRPVVLGALGLTAAIACVVLALAGVFSGSSSNSGQAFADVIKIRLVTTPQPQALQLKMSRTPLGAAIVREGRLTQQNVQTGTLAQNRVAIAHLLRNEKACEQAAAVMLRVHAKPSQHKTQHYWVLGTRIQATGDRQLIAALRAVDVGHVVVGKCYLTKALNSLDHGDGYTGWAENSLLGDAGPRPHFQ